MTYNILVECNTCKKVFEPCCAAIEYKWGNGSKPKVKAHYLFTHYNKNGGCCRGKTSIQRGYIKEQPLYKNPLFPRRGLVMWKKDCKHLF